jgi:PAS domain-containing protein
MKATPPSRSSPPAEPVPAGVFGRLLEATADPVAIATEDGRLLFLNPQARILAGVPPDAPLESQSLASLQPAWAWEIVRLEGIPTALQRGHWSSETAVSTPGGGEAPVRQTLVTFVGENGDTYLGSIMRDLSEAKRAELDRMAAGNRFEMAIRLGGFIVFDWNPANGSLDLTGDLRGLLGLNPADLAGGFNALRTRIHPEDLPEFDHEVQRFIAQRDTLHAEFRILHGDGSFVWLRTSGGYYLDRTGNLGRVTGLLANRTDWRELEADRNRLREELQLYLEQPNRRQKESEFFSRVSHELRTPLNAILGFTQLLELESPTPRQGESIKHIVRAGEHLLALVDEMLDLSRVIWGRIPLNL